MAEKYTVHQVIAALQATKGMMHLAAKRLGCSRHTIRRYMERHESIREAIDAARGEMVDLAELKLWQSIQNGEAWGITLCLKTLGKERGYVERSETRHSGDVKVGLEAALAEALRTAEAHRNGHNAGTSS